jgi:hypothetical protein
MYFLTWDLNGLFGYTMYSLTWYLNGLFQVLIYLYTMYSLSWYLNDLFRCSCICTQCTLSPEISMVFSDICTQCTLSPEISMVFQVLTCLYTMYSLTWDLNGLFSSPLGAGSMAGIAPIVLPFHWLDSYRMPAKYNAISNFLKKKKIIIRIFAFKNKVKFIPPK